MALRMRDGQLTPSSSGNNIYQSNKGNIYDGGKSKMDNLGDKISNKMISININDFDIRMVMQIHGILAIIIGTGAILIPHAMYNITEGNYNHMAHEFVRLYGCLTFCIGLLVWAICEIRDGRLMKAISESFAICYLLQAIVIFRAQFTNPDGHSYFHWLIAILFLLISLSYGYIRLIKKVKSYELPGLNDN
jgi:hypothetical protein